MARSPIRFRLSVFVLLLTGAALFGCEDNTSGTDPILDEGNTSDSVSVDADSDTLPIDATDAGLDAVPIDTTDAGLDAVPIDTTDAGPAAPPCDCQEDQVWLVGACVPTRLLGCGETCSVDDPAGCPEDWQCDPAAATPLCTTSSNVPACIPPQAMGFADGDLRIHPAATTVGKEVTVSVQGGVFYIGALFWMMRVGDEVLEPLIDWEENCTISIPWTPTQAGTFPVYVAYGSDGTPNINWTLAGFITVDTPSQDTQPGFSCTSETTCAQAPPYTCTCQDGHCACATDE